MTSHSEETSPMGLIVLGIVRERSRRFVSVKGSQVKIVTYVVTDDHERRYYIEDFASTDHFGIGDSIETSVYVKPYRKKDGDPSYSICVQKEYHSVKGEAF